MARALRWILLACVLGALAASATACGSSSASTSPSTTTTPSANGNGGGNGGNGAAFSAFRQCLASKGVTLPRPNRSSKGQPPSGVPQGGAGRFGNLTAKQQAAVNACRSRLPSGGNGSGAGRGGQANPAFAKYTACLRQHGVTFGATNDPTAFEKASAACAKYAPTPKNGG